MNDLHQQRPTMHQLNEALNKVDLTYSKLAETRTVNFFKPYPVNRDPDIRDPDIRDPDIRDSGTH